MLDRYLVAGGRALDLATGSAIRWHVRRGRAEPPPLFAKRGKSCLIDFDVRATSRIEAWECGMAAADGVADEAVQSFRSALADARDGQPRAIDIVETSAEKWPILHRVLAREARLSGFVPMAADAFGAVLAQGHWRWPSWLKDRAIVIFATDTRVSPDATLALFRLATKDARPLMAHRLRHARQLARGDLGAAGVRILCRGE